MTGSGRTAGAVRAGLAGAVQAHGGRNHRQTRKDPFHTDWVFLSKDNKKETPSSRRASAFVLKQIRSETQKGQLIDN